MFLEQIINSGFAKELIVLIIAMLPIFELRGALPVAINLFHLPWYYALLLSIIGNILPVPFILLFLNSITKLLSRIHIFNRALQWLFEHTRRKGKSITRYQFMGLALFVGVPLPATGAWTGSLVAVLFGMKFTHSFLSISIGVVIAGVIVTCLSLLGWVGAAIAGVVLVGMTVSAIFRAFR